MNDANRIAARALDLRREFDGAFSEPVERALIETLDFLLLQLGPARYAVRLSEISGLFVDRMITKLPGSPPELMGISGFRGAALPVYDFLALLGQGKAEAPRWMMILSAAPVALAFDDMLGHRRVAVGDIRREAAAERSAGKTSELIPADDGQRHYAIVDLKSVIATITRLTGTPKNGE